MFTGHVQHTKSSCRPWKHSAKQGQVPAFAKRALQWDLECLGGKTAAGQGLRCPLTARTPRILARPSVSVLWRQTRKGEGRRGGGGESCLGCGGGSVPAGRAVRTEVRTRKATSHVALWEGKVPSEQTTRASLRWRRNLAGGKWGCLGAERPAGRGAGEKAGARGGGQRRTTRGRWQSRGLPEGGHVGGDLGQESHWVCCAWEESRPAGVWRGPWAAERRQRERLGAASVQPWHLPTPWCCALTCKKSSSGTPLCKAQFPSMS